MNYVRIDLCSRTGKNLGQVLEEMAGEISETLLIRNVEEDPEKQSLKQKIWRESKKIWVVAAPAMFCRLTTFGTGVITQAFIGHVGSKELAAFALVYTVFVRFAQGILVHPLLIYCFISY